MKETIYTIPLRDALIDGECPFCYLLARTETNLLQLYLEGGLMEPDWRGRLLDKGLCGDHLKKIYEGSSRLGVAILVQSLLRQAEERLSMGSKRREAPESSCLACEDLANAFRHYADGYLTTLAREDDFRLEARNSGLCLPHLFELLRFVKTRRFRVRPECMEEVIATSRRRLAATEKDLAWFIQKFDYRFADDPWNGAEDAVERTVRLLGGGMKDK